MPNIVERYNQAERAGRATVSNRAIEAFSLEVFETLGYPCRIDDESELWRYHDVMQEGRFEQNLRLIGSYSEHDFDLVTKTAKQILSFSERELTIRNSGKHALTRSLYQYQLIMKERPHDGPLRILEIGPGSGYLGMLLANDGHQYFAMDAAQAFYLYQKKLWSDIYGSDYFDYSESTSRPDNAKVTHIPWWRFANLSTPIPDVDIVTCNHAFAEMHPTAVKTIFARLYATWGDDDKKLVLAEGLGYDYFRRGQTMYLDIRHAGFSGDNPINEHRIWRPNKSKANSETLFLNKHLTLRDRTKNRFTKQKRNLIKGTLRYPIGQRIAKLMKRGPLYALESTAKINILNDAQTRPMHDFFENLVADERTPDEIFLKPRTGDIT